MAHSVLESVYIINLYINMYIYIYLKTAIAQIILIQLLNCSQIWQYQCLSHKYLYKNFLNFALIKGFTKFEFLICANTFERWRFAYKFDLCMFRFVYRWIYLTIEIYISFKRHELIGYSRKLEMFKKKCFIKYNKRKELMLISVLFHDVTIFSFKKDCIR